MLPLTPSRTVAKRPWVVWCCILGIVALVLTITGALLLHGYLHRVNERVQSALSLAQVEYSHSRQAKGWTVHDDEFYTLDLTRSTSAKQVVALLRSIGFTVHGPAEDANTGNGINVTAIREYQPVVYDRYTITEMYICTFDLSGYLQHVRHTLTTVSCSMQVRSFEFDSANSEDRRPAGSPTNPP